MFTNFIYISTLLELCNFIDCRANEVTLTKLIQFYYNIRFN